LQAIIYLVLTFASARQLPLLGAAAAAGRQSRTCLSSVRPGPQVTSFTVPKKSEQQQHKISIIYWTTAATKLTRERRHFFIITWYEFMLLT